MVLVMPVSKDFPLFTPPVLREAGLWLVNGTCVMTSVAVK